MPRKGKQNGTATGFSGNSGSGEISRNEWKWVNINLTNEDVGVLEQSDATFEYLATSLVSLANDGYGFKVNPDATGESVSCTIYRPNYPSRGVTVGVSAFGTDVRDVILACLYKLDNYGGGDFSGFNLEISLETKKSRFR